MRFTDAHTPSAVCSPTRYGILTGRYCWRTRLKYRVLDGYDPPLIEQGQVTVPTLLSQNGYDTACVGKWHLGMQWTDRDGNPVPAVPIDRKTPPRNGRNVDYTQVITGGPNAVGFDYYFGISASLNMSPFCYLENDRPVRLPVIDQPRIRTDFITVDEGVRSPDFTITGVMPRFSGQAVEFIENQATERPDRPFFLYAPLSSPHLPVVPNEEFKGLSEAGDYGDFVVETDAFVGAVLEALDRTGNRGQHPGYFHFRQRRALSLVGSEGSRRRETLQSSWPRRIHPQFSATRAMPTCAAPRPTSGRAVTGCRSWSAGRGKRRRER